MVDKPLDQITDTDIIDDIFTAVINLAPQLKKELQQIAKQKREAWAGDRVFISASSGQSRSARNDLIFAEYKKGERIAYLARKHNITERRALQIIKHQAALNAAAGR